MTYSATRVLDEHQSHFFLPAFVEESIEASPVTSHADLDKGKPSQAGTGGNKYESTDLNLHVQSCSVYRDGMRCKT